MSAAEKKEFPLAPSVGLVSELGATPTFRPMVEVVTFMKGLDPQIMEGPVGMVIFAEHEPVCTAALKKHFRFLKKLVMNFGRSAKRL